MSRGYPEVPRLKRRIPRAPPCRFAKKKPRLLSPVLAPRSGRGVQGLPHAPPAQPQVWSSPSCPGHSTRGRTLCPSPREAEPSLGLGEEECSGTLNRPPRRRQASVGLAGRCVTATTCLLNTGHLRAGVSGPFWGGSTSVEETCGRWTLPPARRGSALGSSGPLLLASGSCFFCH